MGGKRVAEDQHEILDLLYTKETDRQAKKLARQVAKADKAAKKVPKAPKARAAKKPSTEKTPKVKSAPTPAAAKKRKQTRVRLAAAATVAVAFGGYLFSTGYSFDPDVRMDRAACERVQAALPEGTVTSVDQAETSAASLYRLGRFKMSDDLGREVRSAADAMVRMSAAMSDGAAPTAVESARAGVAESVDSLNATCTDLGG